MSATEPAALGQVAESVKGRDLHAVYLIVGIQGRDVWLADGRRRPVLNPKRKNIRHVRAHAQIAASLADKLAAHRPITDREVREALHSNQPGYRQRAEKEEIACPSRT